jgi:hypothetical protein
MSTVHKLFCCGFGLAKLAWIPRFQTSRILFYHHTVFFYSQKSCRNLLTVFYFYMLLPEFLTSFDVILIGTSI